MVSSNRRRLKKPSCDSPAVFSILDWIGILCSSCFGKMGHFKRPGGLPPYLQAKPKVKLDLKMGNLALHKPREEEAEEEEEGETQTQQTEPLAWEFVNQHDDDGSDSDDDDGMFNGLFYVGTKVLTEVEMRSPVEESNASATMVRTPRRSNNSSPLASSRQLDYGLMQDSGHQKPDLHAEICASSAAIPATTAVFAATPKLTPSPSTPDVMAPSPCSKEAKNVINLTSSYVSLHEQMDQTMECNKTKHFLEESKNLYELSSKADCRKTSVWLKEESKDTHPKEAAKYISLHKEKAQTTVGSLPDCSKSKLLIKERGMKGNGGRRARSLTDQDFAELRGCIDLGFVFTQDRVPDLRDTLPALEVCYAIAHGAISPVSNSEDSRSLSPGSPPISPWRIASPGDQPQQVKARLRHWAQAVACNARQAC